MIGPLAYPRGYGGESLFDKFSVGYHFRMGRLNKNCALVLVSYYYYFLDRTFSFVALSGSWDTRCGLKNPRKNETRDFQKYVSMLIGYVPKNFIKSYFN